MEKQSGKKKKKKMHFKKYFKKNENECIEFSPSWSNIIVSFFVLFFVDLYTLCDYCFAL